MITADLETPRLRRQVINRVNRLDSQSLTKLLFYIDNFESSNEDNDDDNDDGYVDVDFHFPTPETPEEAMKEIEEIEEEIRQGKFVTLEEFIAHSEKKLEEYEDCLV